MRARAEGLAGGDDAEVGIAGARHAAAVAQRRRASGVEGAHDLSRERRGNVDPQRIPTERDGIVGCEVVLPVAAALGGEPQRERGGCGRGADLDGLEPVPLQAQPGAARRRGRRLQHERARRRVQARSDKEREDPQADGVRGHRRGHDADIRSVATPGPPGRLVLGAGDIGEDESGRAVHGMGRRQQRGRARSRDVPSSLGDLQRAQLEVLPHDVPDARLGQSNTVLPCLLERRCPPRGDERDRATRAPHWECQAGRREREAEESGQGEQELRIDAHASRRRRVEFLAQKEERRDLRGRAPHNAAMEPPQHGEKQEQQQTGRRFEGHGTASTRRRSRVSSSVLGAKGR